MINYNVLIVPIWLLYDKEKMEEVILDDVLAENIRSYSIDKRKYLYAALEKINDDFDFSEILEISPNQGDIIFSNSEIYNYLMEFKAFMEDDTFKLLEE